MPQKKTFHVFKEAMRLNSYAEYPIFPSDVDPQTHLSRNADPQPFHLICDGDVVFTLLAGSGTLLFQSPSVKSYPMGPGDTVYVPAGMPHRYLPATESVVIRAKAQFPRLEGVAWYCEKCSGEVHRQVWSAHEKFCQEGYLESCEAFNGSEDLRTCPQCGTVHPAVDVSWNRWQSIAEELRQEGVLPGPPVAAPADLDL